MGNGVTRFKAGDAVFGECVRGHQWLHGGAYAEYAAVPEKALAPKPPGLSFEEAAALQLIDEIWIHLAIASGRRPDYHEHCSALGGHGPDGMVVAQKPKNFRMQSGFALGGDQLDIGSNAQEFWMFVKQPKPTFLFCSHTDFPKVQDDLPVPFEPDWVLQALGMSTYDSTKNYEVEIHEKNRAYYLKYEDTTPAGQKVMRVTEFAADATEGNQPQVRRHMILAQTKTGWQTNMIAEIHKVSVVDAGNDAQTGQRAYVQVPTDVTLEWPQQKVKLALSLGKPQLNTREEAVLFSKPAKIDNASPVNLADYRSNGSPSGLIRGATPGDLPVERKRK